MFMGKYQNSIDAKFRVIIPSKFREELGYKCVLTKGLDKCLYIYTMDEWRKFAEKLAELPQAKNSARAFVRICMPGKKKATSTAAVSGASELCTALAKGWGWMRCRATFALWRRPA